MKIQKIQLIILEDPDQKKAGQNIVRVPGLFRTQYTHKGTQVSGHARQNFIKVITDEGIEGLCTTTMGHVQIDILRRHAIGQNPLHREHLFQMLYKGTRWVYQPPGWFGDFDNCLWDIAGKAAGLPVHALIGRVRDRFPVYLTGGDMPLEGYLDHIDEGRLKLGISAYKFHSYKGGQADIKIFEAVRNQVGDEFVLINDPVCSYTLDEAIQVGHAMEDMDFVWLEEPMHEQKMHQYQKLCSELRIPVMANEMLMHDMGISTQWLMHGATDRLRANARNGTTQVLKMAHFAEMYDTNIEMNAQGGLFGHIHAHLGCSIDNTDFYETGIDDPYTIGLQWGMTNAPKISEGSLAPNDNPGWGAEWDADKFRTLTLEEY